MTVLIYSCRYSSDFSNNKTVKFLIKNGANVNIIDKYNRSAIVWACIYSSNHQNIDIYPDFNNSKSTIKTVKILYKAGANIHNNLIKVALQFKNKCLLALFISFYINNDNSYSTIIY